MNSITKLKLQIASLLNPKKEKLYFVCSYGGSGSKMLRGFLRNYGKTYHPHSKQPPAKLTHPEKRKDLGEVNFVQKGKLVISNRAKVIYIFRNPIDALKSRYGIEHCKNVEGDWQELPPSIEEYAVIGKDLFGLEIHFNNWTQENEGQRDYSICCIRYETLWHHLKELFDYLEIPHRDLVQFPARKETKRLIDEKTENLLKLMYQPLIDKMDAFPEFSII